MLIIEIWFGGCRWRNFIRPHEVSRVSDPFLTLIICFAIVFFHPNSRGGTLSQSSGPEAKHDHLHKFQKRWHSINSALMTRLKTHSLSYITTSPNTYFQKEASQKSVKGTLRDELVPLQVGFSSHLSPTFAANTYLISANESRRRLSYFRIQRASWFFVWVVNWLDDWPVADLQFKVRKKIYFCFLQFFFHENFWRKGQKALTCNAV